MLVFVLSGSFVFIFGVICCFLLFLYFKSYLVSSLNLNMFVSL